MQWILRFLAGGLIVSLFALVGDVVKPRGFAGLFGAAPSVALATLGLTVALDGTAVAAIEARSMMAGAAAFVCYGVVCFYFMGVKCLRAGLVAVLAVAAWALSAAAIWGLALR